jgi:hypothetical protein
MNQIVHILAEHFIKALESQRAETGGVAERASVFEINPINCFGGRIEKQSKFILTLAHRFLRFKALSALPHQPANQQRLQ